MFRVFIAADMEGITGYVQWPEKLPEEAWLREQMTAEVNASIKGALLGGAEEIIVSDIHWRKQNLLPEKLLGGASLVRGTKRRFMWMDFVERCDLVFLIGFHSGYGVSDAVLPHTIDTRITGLKINGRTANEALVSAVTAGHYGVPVGLATGDRCFINEVKSILPDLETVVVKEGTGNCSALNLHPARALEQIKQAASTAAREGIRRKYKPYQAGERVEMTMEVTWPGYADALSLIPGVRRTGDREVIYAGSCLEVMAILSLFVNWVGTIPGLL